MILENTGLNSNDGQTGTAADKSRPTVVVSQTPSVTPVVRTPRQCVSVWGEKSCRLRFHRNYPLMLVVRLEAGPHLISTLCFGSSAFRHTCPFSPSCLRSSFVFCQEEGWVRRVESQHLAAEAVPPPTPQTALTEICFSASYSHDNRLNCGQHSDYGYPAFLFEFLFQ